MSGLYLRNLTRVGCEGMAERGHYRCLMSANEDNRGLLPEDQYCFGGNPSIDELRFAGRQTLKEA